MSLNEFELLLGKYLKVQELLTPLERERDRLKEEIKLHGKRGTNVCGGYGYTLEVQKRPPRPDWEKEYAKENGEDAANDVRLRYKDMEAKETSVLKSVFVAQRQAERQAEIQTEPEVEV